MFCTNCGAPIYDNEKFCSKCGRAVKGGQAPGAQSEQEYYKAAERRAENDLDAPVVVNITPELAAEVMKNTPAPRSAAKRPGKKRRHRGAMTVVVLLAVVIALLVGIGVASNCTNTNDPQELWSAITGEAEQAFAGAGTSTCATTASTTESAASTTTTAATTTTTTTTTTATTTTTTTTAKTTTTTKTTTTRPTTTTQNATALQALEICRLLTEKKWETTVSGYDAVITFDTDGTALIEVDVKVGFFTVKQKVDATYTVSSRCFAVIKGEYNGMQLGISGVITKISEDELLLDRGGDLGTLTLKAVE